MKGRVFYSASGDQALLQLGEKARYIAFDKAESTAQRLMEVAKARGRNAQLESRPMSFKGNGDPETSVTAVLRRADPEATLLMVDPFGSGEFGPGCDAADRRIPTVIFGAKRPSDPVFDTEWKALQTAFAAKEMPMIRWTWKGSEGPGEQRRYHFHLLVALRAPDDATGVLTVLQKEHEVFEATRGQSHRYSGELARVS